MPLTIELEARELFDEETESFIYTKPDVLVFEHSLASISKWESKYHKPYFDKKGLTNEDIGTYLECMVIEGNPQNVKFLNDNDMKKLLDYIDDSHTATWFKDEHQKPSNEIITNEIIYYWMIKLQIPFECEHWELNRLLTLIRVCGIKDAPQKKMTKGEIMRRNRELNAARRGRLNTHG